MRLGLSLVGPLVVATPALAQEGPCFCGLGAIGIIIVCIPPGTPQPGRARNGSRSGHGGVHVER